MLRPVVVHPLQLLNPVRQVITPCVPPEIASTGEEALARHATLLRDHDSGQQRSTSGMLSVVHLIKYSPDPDPKVRITGVDAEERRDFAVLGRAALSRNLL
jgi:hypothetical protein